MDLVLIQPTLKTLAERLTGLDAYYDDDPRDAMVDPDKAAVCLLTISTPQGIGSDERVQTMVPNAAPGEDIQDEWRGQRQFTLTIKVESYNQDAGFNAVSRLEQVRNRLPFMSTRATLALANLALVKSLPVVNLSEIRDDRRTSIAALDVILSNRTSTLDPEKYPYIDQVKFLANLKP